MTLHVDTHTHLLPSTPSFIYTTLQVDTHTPPETQHPCIAEKRNTHVLAALKVDRQNIVSFIGLFCKRDL